MENYGLILYRESRFLYDKDKTSQYAQQSIVSVVAHEQAHLWFGNLATPQWYANILMKLHYQN